MQVIARPIAAPLLALGLLAGSAAVAAPLTLTGADLLSNPDASFPSVQPTLQGTSLIFAYGAGQGPPLPNLIRYRVNAGGAVAPIGDVTISAIWNVTRLACNGFCAAGDNGSTASDWDPRFYLSDGSTMLGFGLGDSNNGSLDAISDNDDGSYGRDTSSYWTEPGTGYPAIGGSLSVALSFTLHDSSTTGRIQYLGMDRSWTWSNALVRSSSLALMLAQDNDSGERLQVNWLQLPGASTVPEPATLALVGAALLGAAATTRRRRAA